MLSIDVFEDIKNVECPYCGYQLPIIYDKDTKVSGLLVRCKGRNCKRSFILEVNNGVQTSNVITKDTVNAFKLVFGDDYLEHLRNKFGNNIDIIDDIRY